MDVPAIKPGSAVLHSAPANGASAVAVAVDRPAESRPAEQPVIASAPVEDLIHAQQAIAEQVSRYLQSSTRNLEFHVDSAAGAPVIVVSDAEGQVIRRIPGEEALQLMRRLNAQSGTLVDSSA